ncbi:MAG: hypothetical protein M0006_09110 [Magnetospirillum sp.]|nr:hypothetical protein [Magnetospirillum sp.]
MSRTVVVIARSNPAEAMRVAAGVTIMGHTVRLLAITPLPANESLERNLSLAGVIPEFPDAAGLASAIAGADHVLSL